MINATSLTLQNLLTAAVADLVVPPATPPVAIIHDLQGTIDVAPPRLTLFLYEVGEDPSARNRPHRRLNVPPDYEIQRPDMALSLKYLITPWSGDRDTDQRLLERVLRTLYDGAILAGSVLDGALAGTAEALKVTLLPLTIEERTRIWHAVEKPYRLSVVYEVRVVPIRSTAFEEQSPVSRRSLDYGELEPVP